MTKNYPVFSVFSSLFMMAGVIFLPSSVYAQSKSSRFDSTRYYKESIVTEQQEFVTHQRAGNNAGVITSLLRLGKASFKLRKYPDAKQFYSQALERAQRNSAFEEMARAYDGLANVYEAQKDFRKAIESVRAMRGVYDSISIRDRNKDLNELENKYSKQLEEKDRELVNAEAQHRKMQTERLLRLIERDDIQLTFYSVALALIFVVVCLAIAWFFTIRRANTSEMNLRREQAGIRTANEQFEIISRQIHDQLTGSLNDISFSSVTSASPDVKTIGESLINNMMDIVWLINPNNPSLETLIAYIKEKANTYLKKSGVTYMIVVPDRLPNVNLTSLERVNLFFVTSEILHNSVIYSKATGITLSVSIEGRQMIFRVKENPMPVSESDLKQRSDNLKPLRERMEQIDGTIGVVMEQGAVVIIYRKDLK